MNISQNVNKNFWPGCDICSTISFATVYTWTWRLVTCAKKAVEDIYSGINLDHSFTVLLISRTERN